MMILETLKGETYNQQLLIDFLKSPESIRSSCYELLPYANQGKLNYFNYNETKLQAVADFVIKIMLSRYPDLNIPNHSRTRHFEAEGIDRTKLLMQKIHGIEATKSAVELNLISILLDAGAGICWHYMDHLSNKLLSRSEGLAAASYNLFMQGVFSSDPKNLYQVDVNGLQKLNESLLASGLQVTPKNELVGLSSRTYLLQKLADCMVRNPQYFSNGNGQNVSAMRLGNILDYWLLQVNNGTLSVRIMFKTLIDAFSDIWPGRYSISDINLGDVWPCRLCISTANPSGFIAFHKLTQWMCYSLIELLEYCGVKIVDVELLTGLPEYRNGGLFVDMEVLTPKNSEDFVIEHSLDSEFVVEWRAMTVILIDKVADLIRNNLSLTAEQLPLIKLLQGGTWAAGREIAMKLRADGGPPFKLSSDGTLF